MNLQVTLCARNISKGWKGLYLRINLNGQIYFERLNINIAKYEEGTENYKKKILNADTIRILRFNEISKNPDSIYENSLSRTNPPKYLYIGDIVKNGGGCVSCPKEIIEYIERRLYQKMLAFSDFIQFSCDIEKNFDFRSPGEYEHYSISLRISPPYYNKNKPFISLSLIRNERAKVLECFGFPCNKIIKEKKERAIEIEEVKDVKISYIKNDKTKQQKRDFKTYLMKDSTIKYVKIGKSVNIPKREKTLERQNPNISLFAVCEQDVETELHRKYKEYRIRGEWFKLSKKQIDDILRDYQFVETEYRTKK